MRLRTRLALVLVALVLVPLVAAAVLVTVAVPRAAADRADSLVVGTRSAVVDDLTRQCDAVATAAVVVGRGVAATSPTEATRTAVSDQLADWAAVVDRRGGLVASAGRLPSVLITDPWSSCTSNEAGGAAVTTGLQVVVDGRPDLAEIRTSITVDSAYLDGLRSRLGFTGDIALLRDGALIASTSAPETDLSVSADLVTDSGTDAQVVSQEGVTAAIAHATAGMPFDVVVATPTPTSGALMQVVVLVALVALVVAVVAAVVIARDLTGPLEEVTDAAEAVASGDLTKSIEVRRADEVGRLARAFNHMTDELLTYVTELEESRDAARASLDRLGDALSATLDLDTLMPVILETAMTSTGAGAGLVLLGDENGGLTVHAQHGMHTRGLAVPDAVVPGEGLLGSVAASGLSVRGRIGSRPELTPGGNEPQRGQVVGVPLRRPPHVFGVIALFATEDQPEFDAAAESSLQALAGPVSIAVENVMLHAEATHASTIDPLTGVANFRFLMSSLNREVERANRFQRSLSVLMLDLDLFKTVNDTYGHQRGDAVLREFAKRVGREIREVDVLARYGGEEFVVVLPETSADGAQNLAERICSAIRSTPFDGDDGEPPLRVTVSIGGSVYPEQGTTSATLLRAADRALYQAKGAGRDRWVMAVSAGTASDR
jgi:diguanylate cyclase (GGDEF)-like protein